MYAVVWEYVVKDEHLAAFLEAYASGGVWSRLFHRGEGYIRSDLYRSHGEEARFITIDHWMSRDHFTEFMLKHREPYAALDAKCMAWTSQQQRLGEIEP